jgi:tagatose 6-phosphate kinase
MITTVSLNSTTDIIVPLLKFIPGKVLRTPVIYSYPGGKAVNAARVLRILGADVTVSGFCGKADIKPMLDFTAKHGIKTAFTAVPGRNRLCVIVNESSVPVETVINSGSKIKISGDDTSALLKKLEVLSKKSTHMLFSGSLPSGLPLDFYSRAITLVKKNTTVMLDASGRALFHAIKASPQIVKVNLEELEEAFSIDLKSMPKLEKFVSILAAKYGFELFIVTLGENGSLYCEDGKCNYHTASGVKNPISPVGSGDAFSAGLLYGYSKGADTADAVHWADAAAAANLMHTGSCFVNRKDIMKYMETSK